MCLLCNEILKGKITFKEVNQALLEFEVPKDHEEEFDELLKNTYADEYEDHYPFTQWWF